MLSHIGDIAQPLQHFYVRGLYIQGEPGLLQLGDQRDIKAIAQVADESLFDPNLEGGWLTY